MITYATTKRAPPGPATKDGTRADPNRRTGRGRSSWHLPPCRGPEPPPRR